MFQTMINMTDLLKRKFYAVWSKLNNQNLMSTITLEEVAACCREKKLEFLSIDEIEFGLNSNIQAIRISTRENITAILPRLKLTEIDIYNNNIRAFEKEEKFWKAVDWFVPVFMNRAVIKYGFDVVGLKIGDHEILNKVQLQERFKEFFPSVYNFGNIIPITVQTLPNSITIAKHVPVITESILAFYSGMRVTAVASLIPIVEDILNSIIGDSGQDLDLKSKVQHCIKRARENITKEHISFADWIPDEYIQLNVLKVMNERIRIIELIGNWLQNSFYENTENYDNTSGFNRHFFAHAKSEIWQNPSNFFRAMGLIQALAFIECFALKESKLSIFPPEPDSRSKSFYNDVMACLNLQVMKNHILQQLQIQNCLPFNPTASDDGWLGRSAILSSKMNDEIIKKLRDNGWQCHSFGQPVKTGGYITVRASKFDKEIGIALLYSCATDNKVYKELEVTNDYILYQGAPYHQESYACGITKFVGPLNAWLAPD